MRSKKATLLFILMIIITIIILNMFECIDSSSNPTPYSALSQLNSNVIPTSNTATTTTTTTGGIPTTNTDIPVQALAWDKLITLGANNIKSVCILDGSSGWAVGNINSSGQYLYKFTGTNWVSTTTTLVKSCILWDIHGTLTATNSHIYYAVGGSGLSGTGGDIILKYTGTTTDGSWAKSNIATPTTSATSSLFSVYVNSSTEQYIGGTRGRFFTYNNDISYGPISINTSDDLTGLDIKSVRFFSATKAFLAGGFPATNTGYIVKYSSGAWTPESIPGDTEYITKIVWPATLYALAVGNSGKKYQWKGSAWATVAALNGNTSNLLGLFALSPTNIWACGDPSPDTSENIQYFNGTSWYQLPVANMSNISLNAIGILPSGAKGYAFGNSGNIAVGN